MSGVFKIKDRVTKCDGAICKFERVIIINQKSQEWFINGRGVVSKPTRVLIGIGRGLRFSKSTMTPNLGWTELDSNLQSSLSLRVSEVSYYFFLSSGKLGTRFFLTTLNESVVD